MFSVYKSITCLAKNVIILCVALVASGAVLADDSTVTKTVGPETPAASSSIRSNHGFYEVNDPSIPRAVRDAAKSVFRVEFPLYAMEIKSDEGYQELLKLEEQYRKQFSGDQYLLNVIFEQTTKCKQDREKTCFIMTSGTAFLMEDNKTMWTALHNLDGVLDLVAISNGIDLSKGLNQASIEKLKTIKFPVKIYNSEGNQVFGGGDDTMNITELSPWLGGDFPVDSSVAYIDHAKVELSRPLMGYKPLEIGNATSVGDTAYLVGAPRRTTERAAINRPDSPGAEMRISYGQVLSLEESRRRTGQSIDGFSGPMRLLAENSEIGVAGDCASGNSGGPFLNYEGKVVGLFRSSFPVHNTRVDYNRVCQGLTTNFLTVLNKVIKP